jgi:hypothetical protein
MMDSTNVFFYIKLHSFYGTQSLKKKILQLNERAITETDTSKLLEYLDIYGSCLLHTDGNEDELNIPYYYLNTCNKLISQLSKQSDELLYISIDCNELANNYIEGFNFEKALVFSQIAVNTGKFYPFHYLTLALSYVLNNQYEDGEKVLRQLKKDLGPAYDRKEFKEMVIKKIKDLESKGISDQGFRKIEKFINQ